MILDEDFFILLAKQYFYKIKHDKFFFYKNPQLSGILPGYCPVQ